jgi:hypothetical protein
VNWFARRKFYAPTSLFAENVENVTVSNCDLIGGIINLLKEQAKFVEVSGWLLFDAQGSPFGHGAVDAHS